MKTKKIANLALLISLSIILGYIEFLLMPAIAIPGVKIGLSNITVLFVLYIYSIKDAYIVGIIKTFINALLFSGMNAFIYGILGIIISIFVMYLLKKTNIFSVLGISMAGACVHNLAQLFVAVLLTSTITFLYYGPILLIAGLIVGFITGLINKILIKYFSNYFDD